MAVSLENMRSLLLPGLYSVTGPYSGLSQWEAIFTDSPVITAVSLPTAVAMGVAAVIIKNPPVTRRLFGWLK